MRYIVVSMLLLTFSFQLFGQNVIHYSYDSAGNRTQRDTTSTNVAMSPAVDRTVVLEASYDLPSTGDFGKVVISGGVTSPEPIARHSLLEKFEPIKTQPLQIMMSKQYLRMICSTRTDKSESLCNNISDTSLSHR